MFPGNAFFNAPLERSDLGSALGDSLVTLVEASLSGTESCPQIVKVPELCSGLQVGALWDVVRRIGRVSSRPGRKR